MCAALLAGGSKPCVCAANAAAIIIIISVVVVVVVYVNINLAHSLTPAPPIGRRQRRRRRLLTERPTELNAKHARQRAARNGGVRAKGVHFSDISAFAHFCRCAGASVCVGVFVIQHIGAPLNVGVHHCQNELFLAAVVVVVDACVECQINRSH